MISRLFKNLTEELAIRRDPVAFFRSKGVIIGEKTRFYGPHRSMFSTEPYLVKIGSECYITADVRFIPHDGSVLLFRKEYPKIDLVAPITVGDRVFIGSRATILAGVNIGSDCIIGAGSVVSRDIPSGSVAAGVPARVLKTTEEYKLQALEKSVETKGLSEAEKEKYLREKFRDVLEG